MKDFEDTNAIVENMDFIISIDTSLIHLAGSMNKNHCFSYQNQRIGDGLRIIIQLQIGMIALNFKTKKGWLMGVGYKRGFRSKEIIRFH